MINLFTNKCVRVLGKASCSHNDIIHHYKQLLLPLLQSHLDFFVKTCKTCFSCKPYRWWWGRTCLGEELDCQTLAFPENRQVCNNVQIGTFQLVPTHHGEKSFLAHAALMQRQLQKSNVLFLRVKNPKVTRVESNTKKQQRACNGGWYHYGCSLPCPAHEHTCW